MKESQEDVAHSCDTNLTHLKTTEDSDPFWWEKQDDRQLFIGLSKALAEGKGLVPFL